MAKKQKRQVSFTTPSAATSHPAGGFSRPGTEFNPDYTYVKNDLKNMGLQVILFLGILIALTFFLR
ncbi:hypothetical protein [Leptolinea tardivitalis]|uniref:Uncharacterized protein n=1 Tax=Leptolinea tardivitalis TaxID=229920 RepID=A0A0P6XH83_9CHLR|nr:hypothetical protein [Leptolinea tardivitalis]KPL70465.1 hypothetical protein ADM99_15115 [Leptolinea tardivitalis]GAP22052.1 hypothetical protein LTAR_02270 [Leptolinea tardivitalis]